MKRSAKSASPPTDLDALAMRLARECRRIVQACLREDEWIDADEEFARVIRKGLKQIAADIDAPGVA